MLIYIRKEKKLVTLGQNKDSKASAPWLFMVRPQNLEGNIFDISTFQKKIFFWFFWFTALVQALVVKMLEIANLRKNQ